MGPILKVPYLLLAPGRIKDASWTPLPRRPKKIPGTQIHSPENFRKFGKASSSFGGGTENYLTNDRIDASMTRIPIILAVTAP
jgi:hypothetical protein